MRPTTLHARGAVVALGALCFATTQGAPSAAAQTAAPQARIAIAPEDRTLRFGQLLDVRGTATGLAAGAPLALQHRVAGGAWRAVAATAAGPGGRFRLRVRAVVSGHVRVVAAAAQVRAAGASPAPAGSAAVRVAVAPDVVARGPRLDVVAGRHAVVRGVIRPGLAGHAVALQRRTAQGWGTVARARTRRGGAFVLRARTARPLSARVRVRVAGGTHVAPAREVIGRLNVFRHALVSWYGPGLYGRPLGCGGVLQPGRLGVAHKSLPCGARVTLRHGRRTVRVRVIDRGPYVGTREFDLTEATRDRLGFDGVGSVQVTR